MSSSPQSVRVTVELARPLRRLASGTAQLEIEARTVGEAIACLTERYPGLAPYLIDPKGQLRHSMAICVGEDDVRQLEGAETRLSDGQVLSLIPAFAGG